MKWYHVPDIALDGEPFIKKVKVAGKGILMIGYEDQLYALNANCPHAGAELSGGWCKDGELVCPFHRYTYNLQTGKGSPGQNDYIDIYPVKIVAGEVYIGVESFWGKVFSSK